MTDSHGSDLTLSPGPAAPTPPGVRTYVAFAGGGAKGLVHVGALSALESKTVEIHGFAGTSAGALVASLAAAGLRSRDFVDPASARTIVDLVHEVDPNIRTLTDLFGRGGWTAIRTLRGAAVLIDRMAAWTRWTLGVSAAVVIGIVTLSAEAWWGVAGMLTVVLLWLGAIGLLIQLGVGLARLKTLRGALSRLLKKRVLGDPDADREVVFADFDGSRRPLLKIVASDISRKRLQLFSADLTPDTSVADAVCASVCIPFVFVPWRIAGVRYVDGGVVSNFPAWPFDEEKALDPDALTIGFQIGDAPGVVVAAPKINEPVFWPLATVQTALFGSRQLSMRAVGRAELITLPARLKLLDFDLTGARARQEVADVGAYALTQIDDRLFKFPAIYQAACAQICEEVRAILAEEGSQVLPDPNPDAWVRCAVAMPRPADFKHSLATLYGVGYDRFADGDLLWPIQG